MSSSRYRLWLAAENARKAQEEKEQKKRDETVGKAQDQILPYKKGPKLIKDQWEGSQASSNAVTINPEYYMEPSKVAQLSLAAECPDPVPLVNAGNTCFANAGIEKE